MPGAFLVNLQTRTEATNQAIIGVLNELKAIRETLVTDQELSEARSFIIGSFPLRIDSSSKLAQVLAQVEFYGLGLDYFTQYPKAIERSRKRMSFVSRNSISTLSTMRWSSWDQSRKPKFVSSRADDDGRSYQSLCSDHA